MWYSSGRELSDRTKYLQLINGSLEIMNVREKDAGEYECTASNELGRKTVKRKLQIRSELFKPQVNSNYSAAKSEKAVIKGQMANGNDLTFILFLQTLQLL